MGLKDRLPWLSWYWSLRHRVLKARFYVFRSIYGIKEDLSEIRGNISISGVLAWAIKWPLIQSLLWVVSLELLESSLQQFPPFANLLTHGTASAYAQWPYENLVGTVAGVTGVFLALYYTTISGVAGRVFAKMPHALLQLLLREKMGNLYFRSLSVLTGISLLLLGYRAVGGTPGTLNAVLVTLYSCYGVYGFAHLGTRAFHFFDPTKLAGTIFAEVSNLIRSATVRGFAFDNPDFQASYRRAAASRLHTLTLLVGVCSTEEHLQGEPTVQVVQECLYLDSTEIGRFGR